MQWRHIITDQLQFKTFKQMRENYLKDVNKRHWSVNINQSSPEIIIPTLTSHDWLFNFN